MIYYPLPIILTKTMIVLKNINLIDKRPTVIRNTRFKLSGHSQVLGRWFFCFFSLNCHTNVLVKSMPATHLIGSIHTWDLMSQRRPRVTLGIFCAQ